MQFCEAAKGAQGRHRTLSESPQPRRTGGGPTTRPCQEGWLQHRACPRPQDLPAAPVRRSGGTHAAGPPCITWDFSALGRAGLAEAARSKAAKRTKGRSYPSANAAEPRPRAPSAAPSGRHAQPRAARAPARRVREGGGVAAPGAPTAPPTARAGRGRSPHAHAPQPADEGRRDHAGDWGREVLPLPRRLAAVRGGASPIG